MQNLVRIDSAVANLRMHEENVFSCEFILFCIHFCYFVRLHHYAGLAIIITFILHNQALNLYLIATFRSPTTNFFRHVVT